MIVHVFAALKRLARPAMGPGRVRARRTGGALVACLLLLVLSGAVTAHQRLLRSSPADGARLTAPPAGVRLVFAEAVRLEAFLLTVTGPQGGAVTLGALHHPADSGAVVVADCPPLSPGHYAMRWKAVGRDGHPAEGTIDFEILAPRADSMARDTLRPSADTARRDSSLVAPPQQGAGINSPLSIAVRWFSYAALAALIGAFFFAGVTRAAATRGAPDAVATQISAALRRSAVVASVAVVIGAVARVAVQVSVLRSWVGAGSVLPFLTPTWRAGIAAQIAGALVACAVALRGRITAPRWIAGAALGVASLGTALIGHAATASLTAIAVGIDAAHLVGAGAWVGGLAYMSLLAIPMSMKQPPDVRTVTLASVLRAFTPVALGGAAALVVSGVYASWIHVGSIAALARSDYGRVLLLKLALVAAMAVLGALNWRLFGLQSDQAGGLSLRRASRLELALGVMILLATAVLVALPTPVSGS